MSSGNLPGSAAGDSGLIPGTDSGRSKEDKATHNNDRFGIPKAGHDQARLGAGSRSGDHHEDAVAFLVELVALLDIVVHRVGVRDLNQATAGIVGVGDRFGDRGRATCARCEFRS